jgi:hypothetical protein
VDLLLAGLEEHGIGQGRRVRGARVSGRGEFAVLGAGPEGAVAAEDGSGLVEVESSGMTVPRLVVPDG